MSTVPLGIWIYPYEYSTGVICTTVSGYIQYYQTACAFSAAGSTDGIGSLGVGYLTFGSIFEQHFGPVLVSILSKFRIELSVSSSTRRPRSSFKLSNKRFGREQGRQNRREKCTSNLVAFPPLRCSAKASLPSHSFYSFPFSHFPIQCVHMSTAKASPHARLRWHVVCVSPQTVLNENYRQ